MDRPRPWRAFTRRFWLHLDGVLSQIFGATACHPPMEINYIVLIFNAAMCILFIPLALVGLIVCTVTELFLSPANHSKITNQKLHIARKCGDCTEFTLLSNNVCLMPESLSRINNLPNTLERATAIGKQLLTDGAKELENDIELELPANIDVICLQEVFNESAWNILNRLLNNRFGHIIFDSHRTWISPTHFTMCNSGLYIASKYPIIRSEFYPYSDGYLEDKLCCKGLLLVELELGGDESIILGNTHLQAPTGNTVKACRTRAKQWNQITEFLDQFKQDSKRRIKLEVICGDLNTDRLTNYDDLCRTSPCWTEFTDTLSHVHGGTCTLEETCRHPNISTPAGLKQAIQDCDDKYIWSSERETEDGTIVPTRNGATRFDYILYRSDATEVTTKSHIHSTLAALTDHMPISTRFRFK